MIGSLIFVTNFGLNDKELIEHQILKSVELARCRTDTPDTEREHSPCIDEQRPDILVMATSGWGAVQASAPCSRPRASTGRTPPPGVRNQGEVVVTVMMHRVMTMVMLSKLVALGRLAVRFNWSAVAVLRN